MANNDKTKSAARAAAGAYAAIVGKYTEDEAGVLLMDLLADLRHYADDNELDFAAALEDSRTHYKYEVQNPEEAAA